MLLPLGAALFVLAAALAGYVMVKFFGVIFLGQPRESSLRQAEEAGLLERTGLIWLAAGCLALGLLPVQVVGLLSAVPAQLGLGGLPDAGSSWWLLAPVEGRDASYSALVFLGAVAAVVAITAVLVRLAYRRRVRRAPAWGCGFGRLDSRMQDTAEGFGQPIRRLFQPLFAIERDLPTPFDANPHYHVDVRDPTWNGLYAPLQRLVQGLAGRFALVQQGRVSVYLTYSLVTLVVLLALVL
jgi:hypothetical protein